MKINSLALCALAVALMGCSGNSLNNPLIKPDGGGTVPPPEEGEVITGADPVTIPKDLQYHLKNAKVIRGTGGQPDTLLIDITALDTTPISATWKRRPSMDRDGYKAFVMQEDALDRLFFGLAASSADGSVNAVVAGDGGQFNYVYSGLKYERTGAYTPPVATGEGPGRGQVSYKGKYAGLLNGGGDQSEAIALPTGRDFAESEIPGQAARVTGDVFVNANFANNLVNGVVKNRNAVDIFIPSVTTDPASPYFNDGSGLKLQDVVMTPTSIAANGTFEGTAENPLKEKVGIFGGVFGGANASSIAGGINLEDVNTAAGIKIPTALERGVFVLDQCGLTATAGGDCLGTAPTP